MLPIDNPQEHGLGNMFATIGHVFPAFVFCQDFVEEFWAAFAVGVDCGVPETLRMRGE